MYGVYIDSTERYEKLVRLTKNGEVIAEKLGDIDIISAIQDLLKQNNLKISDVQKFETNPGPGSFTGIKVGITIANILNWALGKDYFQKPKYGREPNISKRKKD